jgi:hypothetical protein
MDHPIIHEECVSENVIVTALPYEKAKQSHPSISYGI